MIDSVLQVVFVVCVLVAVEALTDWRWALLSLGVGGFVSAVQSERKRKRAS